MDQIDFNLDNYNFKDILNLFHISKLHNEDMKKAKKLLYKLHPDKCNLDSKYFDFYLKAYKKLEKIKLFISQKDKKQQTEYVENKEENKIIEKLKNSNNFNKIFNQMFEDIHIKDEGEIIGYQSWLESDEGLHDITDLEEIKKNIKKNQLCKHNNFEYNSSSNTNSVYDYSETNFKSNMFSKLQYDDLKCAHTQSVVPVTEDDFNNIKKYNNVEELKASRNISEKPLTFNESNNILNREKEDTELNSCNIAYDLLAKEESIKIKQNKWWAKLKQIKNL